jgi:hypothetical protein
MKFTLICLYTFLLPFAFFISAYTNNNLGFTNTKFDIGTSGRSQFTDHKKANLLNNFRKNDKNLSQLVVSNITAGTISVSPATIYDNTVTGAAGIDRSITITNTGSGTLSVSAINISGVNQGEFALSGLPSLPVDINPSNSVSFSVAFNATSVGLKTASVNITSDDAVSPSKSVPLRGLGTAGLGGTNEPSLQSILDLLEIPINVGDDDTATTVINSSTLLQKAPLIGEEVSIQHFQKAGSGNVTITPLAVFGPTVNATVVGMGWYKSANTSAASELFTVSNNPLSNGQTVNVNFSGSLSFDPVADTFGFYSRWPAFSDRHLYSEDNLNTFSGAIPHHVRVFPYEDKNGVVVSNTYLVAFEENTSGFDYQDIIFVVKNVKPATPLSNALLFIENPDKFPSNEEFVFSKIQIPWSRDGVVYNSNHDYLKVRIHNKGLSPLIIRNLTLSDTTWKIEQFNGSSYSPGAGLPKTVNSGSFVDVMLRFIAFNQATRVKVLRETLTVASNDDKYPSKLVFLNGLWQKAGEGNNEPYAQEIINAFGFKTKTGFNHTDPDLGDTTKLKGDEIKPSYFVLANTALPVSVRQISAYHGCCNSTEKISWFSKGSPTLNSVFTHIAVDGQSLLPRRSASGTAASGTFTPTTAFGFKIGNNDWTDATKTPGTKIGIRVWKAFDSKGNIIPNSYIISNDYLGSPSTNYDYNDNTYFISNIQPEIGTAFFSTLNVAPSALDFGEKILLTADSVLLNIKNNGLTYSDGSSDPAIKISSVEIAGENKSEFTAEMPPVTTLNSQTSSTIKVKFNPLSQGLKIADLLIYYNNSLSPYRVPLYGIAKAANTAVVVNYRIKSGSAVPLTINGKTWSADEYSYDNLEPFTNPSLIQIAATDEDSLYFTEQSSDGDKKPFRYEIPVPNGDYVVRLHFAENYWGNPGGVLTAGAGSRVMSIKLENILRVVNFDIIQEVGTASAIIKNLPVTVTDGKINIDFSASVNRPSVSAIEVYSFISAPLANNILDLKGTLVSKRTELEWVVANQTPIRRFEIERSVNRTEFITIGKIPANNLSTTVTKYNFVDNDPRPTNFYRIKEIDQNGDIVYSKVIRIDVGKNFMVQLYPNPAKNKIELQFEGLQATQKATLTIHTISGNILKVMPCVLTGEKINVDISSLAPGIYIATVTGDNFVFHKKFFKK